MLNLRILKMFLKATIAYIKKDTAFLKKSKVYCFNVFERDTYFLFL